MSSSRVKLQHRPFLTPIWLTVGAAAAALLFVLFVIWLWGTANSTTVIVLSTAGAQRAQLLASMFGAVENPGRLDAIYVSDKERSQLTAAPLAERLRLPLSVAASEDGKGLARRALREHGGGRVMIVAHPDTVPAIVASLSGNRDIPKLPDEDDGVIYVVTVPRIGHANLLRFNY